jgi:neutral trehalase
MSHDEKSHSAPRRFLIDVEETIRLVLEQEDTDGDFQISITDAGPKILSLGTATSNGFKTFDIRVRSITITSRLPTDGVFVKGYLHVVEPPSRTCSSS